LTRRVLRLALRAASPSKFAPGEFVDHSATSPVYSNCCQNPPSSPTADVHSTDGIGRGKAGN